jgi:hypothetical protein
MERSRSLGTAADAEPEEDLEWEDEEEEEELEEEDDDRWERDVSPAPSCPAIREMRWRVDSWWSDVSWALSPPGLLGRDDEEDIVGV